MKYVPMMLIALSLLGFSQDHNMPCQGDFHKKHGMAEKMKFEMLDLTAEQREAIENIHKETKRKIIPLKADIELKQLDLESAMKADEPSRSKIMGLIEDINDLELKIKQTHVDAKLKVHSILTPEQREQMKNPMHQGMKKKVIIKKFSEEECDELHED